MLDHFRDRPGDLVGQDIRDPNPPAGSIILGEDLDRSVVMRRWLTPGGPDMTKCLIVDVDDDLMNRHSIGEGQISRVAFKPAISDKSRNPTFVDFIDIPDGVPDEFRDFSNLNLFANVYYSSSRNVGTTVLNRG
ncbi:MAG: hypothetical protein PHE55_13760 [Methylococcaceae bacterium]|nr:hypothetical protein [Methylococcaceae bacterium]